MNPSPMSLDAFADSFIAGDNQQQEKKEPCEMSGPIFKKMMQNSSYAQNDLENGGKSSTQSISADRRLNNEEDSTNVGLSGKEEEKDSEDSDHSDSDDDENENELDNEGEGENDNENENGDDNGEDNEGSQEGSQSKKSKRVYTKKTTEKIKRWTKEESGRYDKFIEMHADIFSDSNKKKRGTKIFLKMSKFIGTKTPSQCRSHHQKFYKKKLKEGLFSRGEQMNDEVKAMMINSNNTPQLAPTGKKPRNKRKHKKDSAEGGKPQKKLNGSSMEEGIQNISTLLDDVNGDSIHMHGHHLHHGHQGIPGMEMLNMIPQVTHNEKTLQVIQNEYQLRRAFQSFTKVFTHKSSADERDLYNLVNSRPFADFSPFLGGLEEPIDGANFFHLTPNPGHLPNFALQQSLLLNPSPAPNLAHPSPQNQPIPDGALEDGLENEICGYIDGKRENANVTDDAIYDCLNLRKKSCEEELPWAYMPVMPQRDQMDYTIKGYVNPLTNK